MDYLDGKGEVVVYAVSGEHRGVLRGRGMEDDRGGEGGCGL